MSYLGRQLYLLHRCFLQPSQSYSLLLVPCEMDFNAEPNQRLLHTTRKTCHIVRIRRSFHRLVNTAFSVSVRLGHFTTIDFQSLF